MRSPAEIRFRLRQECANLWLLARPGPNERAADVPLPGLPDGSAVVERLHGTSYEGEILDLAECILAHRFPILGGEQDTGSEIAWRRDFLHQKETPAVYFRRLPYLDFSRCGDHKQIWELNRHQHLVVLAQAWKLTGDRRWAGEIESQLQSWLAANPFQRGINWTSALEVAFRALSWIWVWHLAADGLSTSMRKRLPAELYRHGLHLEYNLSVYFSPNTHLLGEAVALHALGVLFPSLPRSRRWASLGGDTVLREMGRQVLEDGAHFEQSSYYHVYALDMFLLRHILEPAPEEYCRKLWRMADYLCALMGPAHRLPLLGDDDGGRLFHPYGQRDAFGRATLATCAIALGGNWPFAEEDVYIQAAWWLGGKAAGKAALGNAGWKSHLFAKSGTAVLMGTDTQVVCRGGPMGPGGSGHSHSDALSLTARRGDEDILVDAGTYTYVADQHWRNWFRGSAAHNTVHTGNLDHASPEGPFRWSGQPRVTVKYWESDASTDRLIVYCECRWRHQRTVILRKADQLLLVFDEVNGEDGEQTVEQTWLCATEQACGRISLAGGESRREQGWRSQIFGVKETCPMLIQSVRSRFPVQLAATIDLSAHPAPHVLQWGREAGDWRLAWSGRCTGELVIPAAAG